MLIDPQSQGGVDQKEQVAQRPVRAPSLALKPVQFMSRRLSKRRELYQRLRGRGIAQERPKILTAKKERRKVRKKIRKKADLMPEGEARWRVEELELTWTTVKKVRKETKGKIRRSTRMRAYKRVMPTLTREEAMAWSSD